MTTEASRIAPPALALTDQAAETIRDMRDQTRLVQEAWRSVEPSYGVQQALSLSRHLADLLTWGPSVTVHRDGDLSLYVQAPPMVFGVIYHPRHYRVTPPAEDFTRRFVPAAPYEGLYCTTIVEDQTPRVCAAPYRRGEPTCHGHAPTPTALPIPGEWSFHS